MTKVSETGRVSALEGTIAFLLLSPHDNHQMDMLHRLKLLKDLELTPSFAEILNLFIVKEIIGTPFVHQAVFEAHPCLGAVGGTDAVAHYLGIFRTRIIEHNLRVVASYYKRINTARLSELLKLNTEELETHLGEMSTSGHAFVKIDRPAGIVCFRSPRQPAEVLSDWSSDIGKLLTMMESTCHLINRENMVYKV